MGHPVCISQNASGQGPSLQAFPPVSFDSVLHGRGPPRPPSRPAQPPLFCSKPVLQILGSWTSYEAGSPEQAISEGGISANGAQPWVRKWLSGSHSHSTLAIRALPLGLGIYTSPLDGEA